MPTLIRETDEKNLFCTFQYLRDYLHLPPEIVPSTLKRQARAEARPRPSAGGPDRRFGGGDKDAGDRAAYRRAPGGWRGNDILSVAMAYTYYILRSNLGIQERFARWSN